MICGIGTGMSSALGQLMDLRKLHVQAAARLQLDDSYLLVYVKREERFRRQGSDLSFIEET